MNSTPHCLAAPIIACILSLIATLAGCTRYHLYWGDVHGHTSLSDGQGTPDEYFTYARDTANLDFTILTDHDFGHGPPWNMPPEDWTAIQDAAEEQGS